MIRNVCQMQALTQRGFTLLEVMVATAILGVSLTLILAAWGGLVRGGDAGQYHTWAQRIAHQKLAEFSESGIKELSADDDMVYGGVKFGVKLKYDPVKDTDWLPQSFTRRRHLLYRVQVDVYWGDGAPDAPGLSLVTHLYKAAL